MKVLFAVVLAHDDSVAGHSFDLVTRFPAKSLLSCLDSTLEQCDLANTQVIVKMV